MFAPCQHFTPSELSSIWSYDPITGVFLWAVRGKGRRYCQRAGNFDGRYYFLEYLGKKLLAHRVAWAVTYGKWPETDIDHKNGDTNDNRIENLRLATKTQNIVNKPATIRSLTGRKGVTKDKRDGRFYAYIDFEGKRKGLGGFATLDEATQARSQSEILHYGEYSYYASSASSGLSIPESDMAKTSKRS